MRASASGSSGSTWSAPAASARSRAASERATATDPSGAEQLRRADGGLADRAAGAQHQHLLAGLHAGARGEDHPGGDRRTAPARRSRRHRRRPAAGRRPPRRATARSAMLPSPGTMPADVLKKTRVPAASADDSLDHADALHARHVGHLRLAEVRRARGAEQVQRHDRRRGHPHQHPAGRGLGVRVGVPARRDARGGQDGGAHRSILRRRVDVAALRSTAR